MPVIDKPASNRPAFLLILLLAAVFTYSCVRAFVLSITHDEVLTALVYAKAPVSVIFAHSLPIASNNHLLNTLLIKLFASNFGDAEIILRIPALIGHLFYLLAVYRICTYLLQGWRRLFGGVLLSTSPFLLDFFSIARGYSLGIGLSMFALSLVLPQLVEPKVFRWQTFALGLLFLDLAVLSNIVFVNVLLALIFVYLLTRFCELFANKSILRAFPGLLVLLSIAATPLFIIYRPEVIGRIRAGMEDYGGKSGFWADTVMTLVESSFYGRDYPFLTPVAAVVIIMLLFVSGILLVVYLWRDKQSSPAVLALSQIALILSCIGVSLFLQFHVFGVPFAVDRSALFLIPLFLLFLTLLFEVSQCLEQKLQKSMVQTAAGLAVLFLLFHHISCFNLTHCLLWKYDASTKEVMLAVNALKHTVGEVGRPRSIGATWFLEPSMNYYRFRYGIGWLPMIDRSGAEGIRDIYYLASQDAQLVTRYDLAVLKHDPVSGCILAVRNGNKMLLGTSTH